MRTRSLTALCSAAALGTALTGCGAAQAASPAHSDRSASSRATPSASIVEGWGAFAGNTRPYGGVGSGSGSQTSGHHPQHGAHKGHVTPRRITGIPGRVVQIATSNSDSYALTSSGAVYAAGSGLAGELGNGTTPKTSQSFVRVQFPAGVKIATLPNPMPYDAGMAIATDGAVFGWGNDANQELCQPRGANLDRPVKVPLSHVSLAVGAQRHALYDAGGTVVSCGLGTYGQLGNGTSGASSQTGTPVAVRGLPAGRVADLTSGYGNAGVLMADGAYYDWGLNNHGQVGDGTRTMATTAVHVPLPARVRQISEGGSVTSNGQAMALLSNGQLWEWGAGAHGQIGNGSTADQLNPIRLPEPAGVRFVSVNSGGATDYAIAGNGRLWDWGANATGQLGTGSHATMATRPVRTSLTVSQVSSTAANVEALR